VIEEMNRGRERCTDSGESDKVGVTKNVRRREKSERGSGGTGEEQKGDKEENEKKKDS
jgi:hypothetical protein